MPLRAPLFERLLAYESAIEPAWVNILREFGVNAVLEFSDATKETPYVDVSLNDVVPTTHRHIYQDQMLVDAWTGVLVCRVVTQRKRNSDKQAAILGAIRSVAQTIRLGGANEFPRTLLPDHAVQLIKESGLTRGVDKEHDLDWSELKHDLHFSVRSDRWTPS